MLHTFCRSSFPSRVPPSTASDQWLRSVNKSSTPTPRSRSHRPTSTSLMRPLYRVPPVRPRRKFLVNLRRLSRMYRLLRHQHRLSPRWRSWREPNRSMQGIRIRARLGKGCLDCRCLVVWHRCVGGPARPVPCRTATSRHRRRTLKVSFRQHPQRLRRTERPSLKLPRPLKPASPRLLRFRSQSPRKSPPRTSLDPGTNTALHTPPLIFSLATLSSIRATNQHGLAPHTPSPHLK